MDTALQSEVPTKEVPTALGREWGTGDMAAEPLEFVALVVRDPDFRMQGEALPVGAQLDGYEGGPGSGIDTETSDGSPGVRPQGNTSLDGCRGEARQEQIGLVGRLVGRRIDLVGQMSTPAQSTQDR